MRDPKTYYVYIPTNPSQHPFYTGITNNMYRRMMEHLDFLNDGYTARYHLTRLVYYEEFGNVREAIRREKEIKTWSRAKKIALVNTKNPKWDDLARDWGQPIPLLTPVVPPIKTQIPRCARDDNPLNLGKWHRHCGVGLSENLDPSLRPG